MINLDFFNLVHSFSIPRVLTWGAKDREKREYIRKHAIQRFSIPKRSSEWYAFKIKVYRSGTAKPLDIENVPKLIIDAFSGVIISKDESRYPELMLYPDDDLRYVRIVSVEGSFVNPKEEKTHIEIYGSTKM
jgi:hypothetical protein